MPVPPIKCPHCGKYFRIDRDKPASPTTYTGYLSPFVPEILKLNAKGLTTKAIAQALESRVITANESRGFEPYRGKVSVIAGMVRVVLKKNGRQINLIYAHANNKILGTKILALRKRKWTYERIAQQLKISYSRTRNIGLRAEREARARAPYIGKPITLDTSVEAFDLGVRAANALKNDNISTVRDLVKLTEAELLRCPNFGFNSLRQVTDALQKHGYHLGSLGKEFDV